MQIMPTLAYLAPMTLLFLIGAAVRDGRDPDLRAAGGDPDHRARASAACRTTRSRRPRAFGATGMQIAAQGRAAARPPGDRARDQPDDHAQPLDGRHRRPDRRARASARNIVVALSKVDVGTAFEAGLAIVILAIVLDRLTDRRRRMARSPRARIARRRSGRPGWQRLIGPGHRARASGSSRRRSSTRPRSPTPSRCRSPTRSTPGWTGSPGRSRPSTIAIKNVVTNVVLNPHRGRPDVGAVVADGRRRRGRGLGDLGQPGRPHLGGLPRA